ncbi:hypothetical protein SAMN06269185_3282 [Natronoarchaeum philippinense]|uniref:Uncharacterized protein n=1 Tax=Natronoarchaeum philippinense TaxID=558529 RepID=A0A285PE89_NATPI|nr:hypothetical protein [Natronoarchaeum philippinense]SNZ18181.1 hypothetical protein SAMN06269185_3282 [Natronoarchaeum philippinense]
MVGISLRIDGSDGTTKTTVSAQTANKKEELKGEMARAEVELLRSAWADVEDVLDRRNDRLIIEKPDGSTFFAGRFDEDRRGNGSVTVSVESYELDAKQAEPTGANVVYQNVNDSTIVQDLIDLVPTLSAGTIDTLASNLSMSFSYAEPSKGIRSVAEATGAELRYNYDRTIDYVDRRGTDKPGVVLSPSEQTVVDNPRITEDAREDVTHIRGFGAQSGPDQITATATADSYNGGRPNWKEYENKEIKAVSRLQRIIDQRINEYDGEPRHLDIDTSAVGVDVALGDRVTVQIPEENIDRMLRVISRRSVLGTAGAVLKLVTSNRLLTRDDQNQKARKDLQRFNRGYQGYVDRNTAPYGPEVAGDGNPREIIVPDWPDDIVDEQFVNLVVQGSAWRSPVTPLSHDHSVSIADHSHSVSISGHQHEVDIPGHQHDYEQAVLDHRHTHNDYEFQTGQTDGHDHSYQNGFGYVTLQDGTFTRASGGVLGGSWSTTSTTTESGGSTTETTKSGGATTTTTSDGGGTTTTTDSSVPLSPEITTTFQGNSYYPTDVTISVNGTDITTVSGDSSSSWSETVDLTGELTPGQNTITATPATRGQINLILSSELFRRGRSSA